VIDVVTVDTALHVEEVGFSGVETGLVALGCKRDGVFRHAHDIDSSTHFFKSSFLTDQEK
jgi:hypothetical protein